MEAGVKHERWFMEQLESVAPCPRLLVQLDAWMNNKTKDTGQSVGATEYMLNIWRDIIDRRSAPQSPTQVAKCSQGTTRASDGHTRSTKTTIISSLSSQKARRNAQQHESVDEPFCSKRFAIKFVEGLRQEL